MFELHLLGPMKSSSLLTWRKTVDVICLNHPQDYEFCCMKDTELRKKNNWLYFPFLSFFFFLFNFQPFCLLLRIKGSGVRIYCVYIHTFLCVMPYPEFQAMSLSASHQIMSIVCLESRQCYM